jgi:RND family efflux transporter MFP subunit
VAAPANGTLFSLPVHAGDFVHTGDLLAGVADLHQVRVRAYIDEPELGQLRPDQTVEVTWDALPERVWTGHTETMPMQVIARGARNVGEVLCSVSNQPMELIPNTTVDVHIELNERPNALTVLRGAVQIVGSHRYVYVVEADRLRRREVTVGISSATKFEILSGLQAGDTVAMPGDTPLKDSMIVRVVTPE